MTFVDDIPSRTMAEGATPFDNTQAPFQNLSRLLPNAEAVPLLLPYDIDSLAAGTSVTFFCEGGIPEKWIVAIRPITGSKVSVFPGPQASGIPFRLGGGGKLKLPGVSEYLTILVEPGSAAIYGTVVAIRKYAEFDIDPGELA